MTLKSEYYDYVVEKVYPDRNSKRILFDIVSDLTDRRGFRQEWEQADEDIQEEILSTWLEIIQDE